VAQIRVNPNRMELLKLRRRAETARRGHKLLRDKLDELLKEFMSRIADNRRLRTEVEEELLAGYGLFAVARAEAGAPVIAQALLSGGPRDVVSVEERNVMSVNMPVFSTAELSRTQSYSFATTPAVLDEALERLAVVVPRLVELAEREKAIELLAVEIESTRRRVNALEYVLIPQLEQAVRAIRMKLEETERGERTRLMKVKKMLEEQG
jgi:V/A-type H+/Na+-transporting ATPase subunit D